MACSQTWTIFYRVRKDCYYGSTSGWSGDYTFSTYTSDPCSKPASTGFAYRPNGNPSRVRLYCSYEPDAVNNLYLVRWRETTSSTWQRKTIGKTNYLLKNLPPDTEYVYQFRTKCASGWSPYSRIDTFTTLPDLSPLIPPVPNRSTFEEASSTSTIDVFPNPTGDYLYIDLPTENVVANVNIIDVQGRVVFQKSNTSWENGLDVSGLQEGLYVLRIQMDDGQILTSRFLKMD